MLIVGQISSNAEAKEITFIAKLFVVGNRARQLSQLQRAKDKAREELLLNTIDKVLEEK